MASFNWPPFLSLAGTVTSVGLTVPAFLSVSGSPVTTSGTLAVTLSGTALPTTSGGTGVSNNAASTITISGAFGLTFTLTGTTSLTLPTSGTVVTVDSVNTITNKNYSSGSTNVASAGVLRLSNTETIKWRNAANTLDLPLSVNASDQLVYNGIIISGSGGFTINRAMVTDGSGDPSVSTTTATEIGYVSGVTSAIQTQLNLLAPKASPSFTGTIGTALTASKVVITDGSSNLSTTSAVTPQLGGTGVSNNSASTLTISGSFALTLTLSNTTAVTLPTAGTLATLAGSETLTNKTISGASNTITNVSLTTGVTGTLAAAQFPALTGDITTSAGALATTAAATQANITTLSAAAGVAVHGTNTNNNASAGYVGEYFEQTAYGPSNMGASATFQNATTNPLALTAGDWDLALFMVYIPNGSVLTDMYAGISTTSTSGGFSDAQLGSNYAQQSYTGTHGCTVSVINYRVQLTGNTSYYGKAYAAYTGGPAQYYCRLSARRMR